MINKNIIKCAATLMLTIGLLVSCSKEAAFEVPEAGAGEGRVLTSALNLNVKGESVVTRAGVPTVEQFTVTFLNTDKPEAEGVSYQYKDMPDVVILPVGNYKVVAQYGGEYGNNKTAAFEAPHYKGESESFKVENLKIVDKIEPITCTLANVRVSVNFDPELVAVMDKDVKVNIRIGKVGSDALDFDINTKSDGYFAYAEESNTLAATFSGTVNGDKITEIKTYNNVKPGNYYKITFKLHTVTPQEPGDDDPNIPEDPEDPENGKVTSGDKGSIIVDASVIVHDYTEDDGDVNVDPDSEEYLDDDRYSGDGDNDDDNKGEDPGKEQPENPGEEGEKPIIYSDDVDINGVNDITNWQDGQSLVVKILTDSQITDFVCTIVSETLTKDELEQANLTDRLDLVNGSEEDDLWINLRLLGFPVGKDITDPQEKEGDKFVIRFDISTFMTILKVFEGNHNFEFEVTNVSGTTKQTLILKSDGE